MKNLLITVSIVGVLGITAITNISNVATEFNNTYDKVEIVYTGQNVWNQQRDLLPDENMAKVMHYVEKENNKKPHEYTYGDTLVLYVTK